MHIVIFVTASNKEEAEKIARALVENKLAACVNTMDGIKSVFWWEGKLDSANEVLLIIKSKKSKLSRIITLVKSLHSYQVPEIIALPIISGEKKYLRWLDGSVR
jgi:periplasmic divalent cation tolerance protein